MELLIAKSLRDRSLFIGGGGGGLGDFRRGPEILAAKEGGSRSNC